MKSDISYMNVAEFRAFKKALAALLRAGIDRETAVELLISSVNRYRDRTPIAYAK